MQHRHPKGAAINMQTSAGTSGRLGMYGNSNAPADSNPENFSSKVTVLHGAAPILSLAFI